MVSLAAALLFCQVAANPLGDLSRDEFVELLRQLGVKASSTKALEVVSVQGPHVYVRLNLAFNERKTVQAVFAGSTFQTPRYFTRAELQKWVKAAGIDQARNSFGDPTFKVAPGLNTTVTVQSLPMSSGKDDRGDVKTRIEALISVAERLKSFLGPSARQLDTPWEQSTAKFDPTIRLEHLEAHDVEYILSNSGWHYPKGWGGSSNGWVWPGNIDGVTLWFHELVNPTLNGVPDNHDGVYLSFDDTLEPKWVSDWVSKNKDRITWARVEDESAGRLVIRTFIDLHEQPTIAQFQAQLADFAKHVKELNLPKPRGGQ